MSAMGLSLFTLAALTWVRGEKRLLSYVRPFNSQLSRSLSASSRCASLTSTLALTACIENDSASLPAAALAGAASPALATGAGAGCAAAAPEQRMTQAAIRQKTVNLNLFMNSPEQRKPKTKE